MGRSNAGRRTCTRTYGPRIAGVLVDALLDPDRDFVIRRRVPRVLATIRSARSAEGLFEALQDQRFEVRFYAGRALHLLVKDRPELMIAPDRVWHAVNSELSLQRSVWANHRLLDRRGSHEKQWFFDDQLLDHADRNLEHLFTLLGLLLPGDAVRIAFRALHTNDRHLKDTAFEYLESATPPDTRRLLLPLLEADAEGRLRSADAERALRDLLASQAKINTNLNIKPSMERLAHPFRRPDPRFDFPTSGDRSGLTSDPHREARQLMTADAGSARHRHVRRRHPTEPQCR